MLSFRKAVAVASQSFHVLSEVSVMVVP